LCVEFLTEFELGWFYRGPRSLKRGCCLRVGQFDLGMKHEFCCLPACLNVLGPETSWSYLCPEHYKQAEGWFEGTEYVFEEYWGELVRLVEEGD
jgi:hypothetical protein